MENWKLFRSEITLHRFSQILAVPFYKSYVSIYNPDTGNMNTEENNVEEEEQEVKEEEEEEEEEMPSQLLVILVFVCLSIFILVFIPWVTRSILWILTTTSISTILKINIVRNHIWLSLSFLGGPSIFL